MTRRIPYVAVDEARKALLPQGPVPTVRSPEDIGAAASLKSFDFVIYGQGSNLLVEIKGRRVSGGKGKGGKGKARLESWVTMDDVASLRRWEGLFGPEFQATFVFVYWCERTLSRMPCSRRSLSIGSGGMPCVPCGSGITLGSCGSAALAGGR